MKTVMAVSIMSVVVNCCFHDCFLLGAVLNYCWINSHDYITAHCTCSEPGRKHSHWTVNLSFFNRIVNRKQNAGRRGVPNTPDVEVKPLFGNARGPGQ